MPGPDDSKAATWEAARAAAMAEDPPAEPAEPVGPSGENGPAKGIEYWTVGAVGLRLVERLHAARQNSGLCAWPGTDAAWPDDRGPVLTRGLLPMPADEGDSWDGLWHLLGPPRPDWLAVVVGRPGRGKSGWALQSAIEAAIRGAPAVYMSCEMGDDELLARALAARSSGRIPWRTVMRGGVAADELDESIAVLDAQAADPSGLSCLYLWAPSKSTRNLAGLRDFVREVAARHNRAPLVVVDYVQRLGGENENDRRIEIQRASGELRDLSRPSPGYPGAAILAVSSTARGYYRMFASCPSLLISEIGGFVAGFSEKGPVKTYQAEEGVEGTGKETGELEYDASVVLALTCDADADEVRQERTPLKGEGIEGIRAGLLVVAKNRAGRTGWVPMLFHAPTGRWTDWSERRVTYLEAIGRKYDPNGGPNGNLDATLMPRNHAPTLDDLVGNRKPFTPAKAKDENGAGKVNKNVRGQPARPSAEDEL